MRTSSLLLRGIASLLAGSVLQALAVEPQIGIGASGGVSTSTMMIKADGTLWGWGSTRGIGDGSVTVRPVPVQIGTGANWSSLAMGGVFGMGIRADGSLWSWGENQNGVLGNGTMFDPSPTPTQVGSSAAPHSVPLDCASRAPGTAIEGLETAGNSTLTYDASNGQYVFVWKTEKAWAGACRQVLMRFTDGTERAVLFDFR